MCSGKIYYDLLEAREKYRNDKITFVRIEQLYPFPVKTLANILKRYSKANFIWCQEEPKNMGAWSFLTPRLTTIFGQVPLYAGRPEAASPAVGCLARHKKEHAALLDQAFTL